MAYGTAVSAGYILTVTIKTTAAYVAF